MKNLNNDNGLIDYIGANGKSGVTVYKPVHEQLLPILRGMILSEANYLEINIKKNQYKSNDRDLYLIRKTQIDDVKNYLSKHPLYYLATSSSDRRYIQIDDERHSTKFDFKKSLKKLDGLYFFHIQKKNSNNKIFEFDIVIINTGTNIEAFSVHKRYSHKIKMRMFKNHLRKEEN
jgi:hypothetical protein